MKAFTKFALAALTTMTLVGGVSAQDRHGDPDELDANTLAERRQEILDMSKGTLDAADEDESAADLIGAPTAMQYSTRRRAASS